MAIYHLSVKPVSRSSGRSSVASAAYRAGARLTDFRDGRVHDYAARKDVAAAFVLAPTGSPAWALSRESLWNAVEAAEKRVDARTAREIVLALPRELTQEQMRDALVSFLRQGCVAKGMVCDVALHGLDSDNPHAHVLLSTRKIDPETQCFGPKERAWDSWGDGAGVLALRSLWERCANASLKAAGRDARIDSRSLASQGIERVPTVHLGPKWSALNRKRPQRRLPDRDRRTRTNAAIGELAAARAQRWQRAAGDVLAARRATAHYGRLIAAWRRQRDEQHLRAVVASEPPGDVDSLLPRMRGYQAWQARLDAAQAAVEVGTGAGRTLVSAERELAIAHKGFLAWRARAIKRLVPLNQRAVHERQEAEQALDALERWRQNEAVWRDRVRSYAEKPPPSLPIGSA